MKRVNVTPEGVGPVSIVGLEVVGDNGDDFWRRGAVMVVSWKGRLQVAREAARRCRVEGRVDWPVQLPGPGRRYQHEACPLQHTMPTSYRTFLYTILEETF